MPNDRIRVATIITRLHAGAGGVALRGALSLDPERYETILITGPGSASDLLERAAAGGVRTFEVHDLVREISPRRDRRALEAIRDLLQSGATGGSGRSAGGSSAGSSRFSTSNAANVSSGPSAFDIVHTHSAKAGVLGRTAADRLGVGLIVHTLHGFPFHEFQPRARRAAYLAVERRLGRVTDVTLAVGASVAAEAVRLGIAEPHRLRTIAPAADIAPNQARPGPATEPATELTTDPTTDLTTDPNTPPALNLRRQEARKLLGIPDNAEVVGTVGRLEYQKAPEHFLEAFARLSRLPSLPTRDLVAVWIGGGSLLRPAMRHAQSLGIGDRIRFTGERDDVAALLPAFDVFALASRYEGQPVAVVEAMAAGIPVVATAVNAVPDLVVPGETGLLVPPANPEALAQAIGHLLRRPEAAAQMATAARAALGDRFTAAALGAVLDEVYALRTDRRRTTAS